MRDIEEGIDTKDVVVVMAVVVGGAQGNNRRQGCYLDVLRGLETVQLVEQLQHGALHLRVTT